MTDSASPVIDVHLILRDGDNILLSQRGGPYGYGIPYPAAGLQGYLAGDPGVTVHGWAGTENAAPN